MITANLAFGYNKEVFAIPGRPKDIKSKGCNHLIQSNKAMLVESATDIAQALNWSIPSSKGIQQRLFIDLNDTENEVFSLLKEHKEMQIEEITTKSSLSLNKINSTLLSLEFKGIILSLPGKRYILT